MLQHTRRKPVYRLDGTREGALTFEEIEREARDTGNLLALAACRIELDMVTDDALEDAVAHAAGAAEYHGAHEMWCLVSETLTLAEQMLRRNRHELEAVGESTYDLNKLLEALRAHLEDDKPKPAVTEACIPVLP